MVNISHDDYFSSSTINSKELSPEDIKERIGLDKQVIVEKETD